LVGFKQELISFSRIAVQVPPRGAGTVACAAFSWVVG
jgi:hypothetical protein